MNRCRHILGLALTLLLPASGPAQQTARIVSLNGSTTEILFALGVGDRLVGRDASSLYPAEALKLPSIGYLRSLNTEGILALRPSLAIGTEDVKPTFVLDQLRALGVHVVIVTDTPTLSGLHTKIRGIARAVERVQQGETLIQQLDHDVAQLEERIQRRAGATRARALFLYLRGPQTTFVCGRGSDVAGVLALAGIDDAAVGIDNCKVMTAEAVIAAQPDVIVVFTRGLASVGGIAGLLALPAVAQTPAGRARRVVALDDLYLGAFGPRTGRAALDLHIGVYERKGVFLVDGGS